MATAAKTTTKPAGTPVETGVSGSELWKLADTLRGNIDAAEYKHIVLPLMFLKYISDAFEELHQELESKADEGYDPEQPDEYAERNVFWVPMEARWSNIQSKARQEDIGATIDRAMDVIERENKPLQGVLPKNYGRDDLDKQVVGQVVDLVSNIKVGGAQAQATDVLGQVYEYFLEQFAIAEGRKGGEFYTPRSVVRLLVEMIEPYEGRVFDPCCGSAGMFVQSVKFIEAHATGNGNGKKALSNLSIYGQESNQTTLRLAKMNLAIRGIDAQIEFGDSFRNDQHPDLRADYILANPPFNISEWNGDQLREDKRWVHGTPPVGNANYAWVQHFLHHLAPRGIAGFVLANGSMSSNMSGEGEIRKNIVEADLVDCIIALPGQLFRSTQIPACLWFLSKGRSRRENWDRQGETLFIDARKMGHMTTRTFKDLSEEDVERISGTYHAWRDGEGYEDEPGFCKSATLEEIQKHGHVLTPGRYVGAAPQEDDGEPFQEKMSRLTAQWREQQTEAQRKAELSTLFSMNEFLMVSDGLHARVGTLTAGKEWFKPWKTMEDQEPGAANLPELQVMLEGVCEQGNFLNILRDFIVFDDDGSGKLVKKMAGYHQFHAVQAAVEETLRATELQEKASRTATRHGGAAGDRRIGVVWHNQGSGKSLTMAFYAGAIIRDLAMNNPTIVVLTDRNDLDDQLFGTFSRCQELLRQDPAQAESRADLRNKLSVNVGGVVFTTIQKFFPEERGDSHPVLSERRNIVVIADEAHRSQYDFIDGYARHMRDALPNASFLGFTGTPVELDDANTRAVFGDYISVYDITRSEADGATVPIYYESRLAQLALDEAEKPNIDPEFEELTEGEELEEKEALKTKWAQLEAVVGADNRVRQIAEDIVGHFDARLEQLNGKAMVVCMSRRICVELYRELVRLRPQWQDADDTKGEIKVVMTGSASDPLDWQKHIRSKSGRETLANRFRDPDDPFRVVLVRDMWLTGFDAPSLHTMYVDKPMQGHGLFQAITRVNRVFKDKPGGLVVDYLGLANDLRKAVENYTRSGGRGKAAFDKADAVAVMLEKHEVCCAMFHGFDWSPWVNGGAQGKLTILPPAQEHILAQKDGKERFLQAVMELTKAFTLSVPDEEAIRIRDDVNFFQTVRAAFLKKAPSEKRTEEDLESAIRQIVSRAVASEGVVNIFAEAGLRNPDISVLSPDFLAEVRGMPHRNLAVELLQKLIRGELSTRRRQNVIQARSFAGMLEDAIRRYQNRTIEAAQVIEELIELAKEMREDFARGQELGLNEDELAFYDALETNDSAVKVLGDETLRTIAQELVETVRRNATIDWTVRESVRAGMRNAVRRVLRKHGYPPDKEKKAIDTVIEQAELLSEEWTNI